jgi:lipopolysaccharide/colanic/teichoic acid biosynthesis glycosyltransferase
LIDLYAPTFGEIVIIPGEYRMLAQHLSPPSDSGMPAHLVLSQRSETAKRVYDFLFGLAIAIFAIPVMIVAWILVRATSSGPGFYTQLRVGRNGRHYRIYKIRTMYTNCEAASGAAWSTRFDPRVTPIGRIFRTLHIDELPQLLNVFRGDMSLVGPRPERPEFVGPLSEKIPNYNERHLVRPGVTGLAQIQLPADSSIDSVQTKLVLDRCYVQNGCIWLDFRIMLGTVVYLVGLSYARVRKLMWLPNPLAEQCMTNQLLAPHVIGPFKVMGLFPTRLEESTPPKSPSEASPVPCGEVS